MTHLTQSYFCGAAQSPLLYETIGNCLDNTADMYPEREALVVRHQNIRWSYRRYQQEIDKAVAAFQSRERRFGKTSDQVGSTIRA